MALADVAARLSSGVPWRTCAVCHHLATMAPEDAEALRGMLADRGLKFKTIAAELERDPESPTIPWEALSRHAQAGCSANERLR